MKFKFVFAFFLFSSSVSFAAGRYYYEGDGCLFMVNYKTKTTFKGCYRKADGTYDDGVLQKIDSFFQIPGELNEHFSLRTLSFLDYLQDKYVPNPKTKIRITSAYRSPTYNEGLRKKGKLAGKTSYHLEGMAVDVVFPGVKSEDVWNYAKGLKYGGMGYYRSKALHVDSGKPRSWTPENAIDPDNIPPLNKNIYLSVDKDIYFPGEEIQMFFSGISDYPYGVHVNMEVFEANQKIMDVKPVFINEDSSDCLVLKDRNQVRNISWKVPENFSVKNQKLHFKVSFCEPIYSDPKYDGQPLTINSREFEIR